MLLGGLGLIALALLGLLAQLDEHDAVLPRRVRRRSCCSASAPAARSCR